MTLTDIATMVGNVATAAGLPWVKNHFAQPQEPPYMIYLITRDDFYADDANYQKIATVAIEYYYDEEDPETQQAIEEALPAAYTVSDPIYLESEHMYEIIYEMEVPYEWPTKSAMD